MEYRQCIGLRRAAVNELTGGAGRDYAREMKRVAIAGMGYMGKVHLGVYQRLPGVKVEALFDTRAEALEVTSLDAGGNIRTTGGTVDLTGVRRFTDYAALLAEGGFDFVDICLPTHLHGDHAIRALERGYHVFCEKPLALDPAEARRIVHAVRSTGRLMSVGQCLRFWPAYAEARRIVTSGRYGAPRAAELVRLSSPPGWSAGAWHVAAGLGGNAALDLHVHDVDMILWLFGRPRSVRSAGVQATDGSYPHISTVYGYDGLSVTAVGGWICSPSFPFTMRALYVLEQATIELDFRRDPVLAVYPVREEPFAPSLPEGDGYFHELVDFVAGLEAGKLSGTVTVESAAEAVEVCHAEVRSAREGREVYL
jgi:1,5-anhydro-D-fructose reductase (1,5-anhydro-D-mannitol-forming)